MQSVWARGQTFIFYKGKPFPLPLWVYSFASPSHLLYFLHQVQRAWSFVEHLPFGSNNTGNEMAFSKLGPKYLPMGIHHLGTLSLGTKWFACRAPEPSSPLTSCHASDAPATTLPLPWQCPRSAFFPTLKTSCRIWDVNPNPPVESGWEPLALGETPRGQSDAANRSFHRCVKGSLVRNGRVPQMREGEGRGPAGEYSPAGPAGPIMSPKARIP